MSNPAIDLIILFETGGDKEGGLNDHPKDPGGITKWGICLKAYPSLGREGIINLTREQAVEIYERDYWQACHCDQLPPPLATLVFDCAVNQGVPTAIRLLQRALKLKEDGKIGYQTLKIANTRSPRYVCVEYAARRAVRYGMLKTFSDFGLGWMRRLMTVLGVALSQIKE